MLIQDSPKSPVPNETEAIVNWISDSQNWAFAYDKPSIELGFKQSPQDFQVKEVMPLMPPGEGEHWWLYIKKTKCHTADVSKALARFAEVSYRDVGYSGLKDYFAETYQWFSIYRPKGGPLDWAEFNFSGTHILAIEKHNKKLRRSTHSANEFEIVLRSDVIAESSEVRTELEHRLNSIEQGGVPNYFGLQRFGRGMSNLDKASEFFSRIDGAPKRFNDKQAMWVSAARAWLFNTVLAERVKDGSWNELRSSEPCNLNATQSYFLSSSEDRLDERLANGDIHPTAPMWGGLCERDHVLFEGATSCLDQEQSWLTKYEFLKQGLEKLGLPYKRRSTRCMPSSVCWHFEENSLVLRFTLLPGQYATSVLRELACFY